MHRLPAPIARESITGVILAGGAARRMGGVDKGLIPVAGLPLIGWVLQALAPQVGSLMISANRHLDEYGLQGYPVVSDLEPGFQGPLAGILSAMRTVSTDWVLTLPCDGPRPPTDLTRRLVQALLTQGGDLAVATDGRRRQYLHALLPVSLSDSLARYLASGERRVEAWQACHRVALADFSDCPEGFANLNSPDQLRSIEHGLLGPHGAPLPDAHGATH